MKTIEYVEVMLNHDQIIELRKLVDTMEESTMKNDLTNALARGLLEFGKGYNMKVKQKRGYIRLD